MKFSSKKLKRLFLRLAKRTKIMYNNWIYLDGRTFWAKNEKDQEDLKEMTR